MSVDVGFCGRVVEETMRFHGPTTTNRLLTADLTYRDVLMPAGTVLWFPWSVIGRDETTVADADGFDPDRRQEHPHLGFALGAHICLGQFIARAQLAEGLHLIARRITRPRSPGPLGWRPFPGVWGIRGLPMDNWHTLDQALNDKRGVWRRFMCPDIDSDEKQKYNANPDDQNFQGQGTMMVCALGDFAVIAWSTNSDYAVNEGVMGYHWDPVGIELFLAGQYDGRTMKTDWNAASTDPGIGPDPARKEEYDLRRIGIMGMARVRVTLQKGEPHTAVEATAARTA